ncbi:hypothetical protein N9917_00565 [Deltaproteobacteria bacterium]|nr:hypothetical protein [Deltaproteobacteria bacterium]
MRREVMEFTKRDPPAEYTIHEWRRGDVSVVICPFSFGQHRVQVWVHSDQGRYPELLAINF